MSKRTRLLGRLKHVYSHNTKLVLDVSNDDIGLIIEGVEKQIRKKPKDIDILVGFNTKEIKYGNCPICFNEVNNNGMKYCACCGQKLDWSEDDENKEDH